jgi:flagellum-specific ATP synthase
MRSLDFARDERECLAGAARELLSKVAVAEGGPRKVGRLVSYDGLMLEATGLDSPVGAGARIVDADGHVARAEVWAFAAIAPC